VRFTVACMEPTATSSFSERLRRFVRWFFTVTPEAVAAPSLRAKTAPGRRHDAPAKRAHAHQAGRVQISERKQP